MLVQVFLCLMALMPIVVVAATQGKEIHDPLNIFCGPLNCYDILNVERTSSARDIKKAYRKLSLTHHPDKSKDQNATEVFRRISKAYEVLEENESRTLFDYYLDHPRDYFKVSGQHYFRNLPKADVRLVIFIAIALISWFVYTVQYQRYRRAVNFLKSTTLATGHLSIKNGGSEQATELFARATDLYEEAKNEGLSSDQRVSINKSKMVKDPDFAKFVEQVALEVKIEGGYRKPEWQDLVAVQLVILPYTIFKWAKKYHRRHISTQPFTEEEKLEMAIEALGMAFWENLSEADKQRLIAMEIWRPEVKAKFEEEEIVADEQVDDEDEDVDMQRPLTRKERKLAAKKAKKSN